MKTPSQDPEAHAAGSAEGKAEEGSNLGIPDFQLIKRIGRGSYGQVWLARSATGSYRAVKVVFRELFDADKPYEREFSGIKEFEPISRAHPGQLDILHVGRNDEDGFFYYVMELADDATAGSETTSGTFTSVPGGPEEATGSGTRRKVHPETYEPATLQRYLEENGRLGGMACLEMAIELSEALGHLHTNGLVHRDIKPSNIIFVRGRPKLADIGLVAHAEEKLSIVGTEGFLPPEGPGQPTADLYALGKVFYEMATGNDRKDFPRLPEPFEDHHAQKLFVEFNEVILRCCERSAENRYQSAADLLTDLNLLRQGRSIRRLRAVERRLVLMRRISLVGMTITALIFGGYLYQRGLAKENRVLADRERKQREKAEEATREARDAERRYELGGIEQLLESGQTGRALAALARRLIAHPEDTLAARRLLAALTYRDFALPLAEADFNQAAVKGAALSPDGRFLAVLTLDHSNEGTGHLSLWAMDTWERVAHQPIGGYPPWGGGLFFRLNAHFNRDGSKIVIPGGSEMAARIWEMKDGLTVSREIERPEGSGNFSHAEFSPDGGRIVAMARTGEAFIWDAKTGELLVTLDTEPFGQEATLAMCRFTPGGERVMTSVGMRIAGEVPWKTGNISVCDSRSGELVNRLDDESFMNDAFVFWKEHIALDPRQPRLVYVRGDGWLKMWNYATGALVDAPQQREKPIRSVAFSPDGRLVASGGDDGKIRVWETGEGELNLRHVLPHPGKVISVAFSPDGQWLASGSGTVRLWDIRTGRLIREPFPDSRIVLQFTPDGKRLISFSGASELRAGRGWDLRPGAARPALIVHEQGVNQPRVVRGVRYSPDGSRVVSSVGFEEKRPSYHEIAVHRGGGRWTRSIHRDGVTSFQGGGGHPLGGSRVWKAATAEPVGAPLETIHGHTPLAITPDGTRAVAPIEDGFVLWDPRSGVELRRIKNIGYDPRVVEISPDGRWAYTNAHDGAPKVWNLATGKLQWPRDPEEEVLIAAAFSPDSRRLLTVKRWGGGPEEPRGLIRRVEDGGMVATLEGVYIRGWANWVEGHACWSPDGQLVAVAHGEKFRIHDSVSGQPIGGWLVEHGGLIVSARFSADGRYFLTASGQTTKIWDVRNRRQAVRDLGHEGWIAAAAFGRDARVVATGGRDKVAKVWDRASGFLVADPFPHPDEVLAVDFHSEGKWLATGCADGVARLWELPQAAGPAPDWLPELAEAVGGYRLTEVGSLENSSRSPLELKERLGGEGEDASGGYVRWARWFFADRERRAISPSAEITMEDDRKRGQ